MLPTRTALSLAVVSLVVSHPALATDDDGGAQDPPPARQEQPEPAPEAEDDAADDDAASGSEEAGDEEGDAEEGDAEDGDAEDGDAEDGDAEDGDDDGEEAAPMAPAEPPSALRAAVEDVLGAPVHGRFRLQYRGRWSDHSSDQDLYGYWDLRIGDEWADELTASFSARGSYDLDGVDRDDADDYVFSSLADTYDSRLNGKLYTGYLNWRPEGGWLKQARVGRQYVYAGETFHIDGVHAETNELVPEVGLTVSAYGGVPVHIYESSPGGDWLAGAGVSVEPWDGTRATAEYVHVEDDVRFYGDRKDDLAKLTIWQRVGAKIDVEAEATYLEGLRDVSARVTARDPDLDLLVQLAYFRLLETKKEFVTEFDAYFSVLQELREYQQAQLRVAKGFGDHFSVEAGAFVRRLAPGEDEGAFNRDIERYYVTPMLSDLPWEGSSLSLIGEIWDGGDTRIETFGGEFRQEFGDHSVAVGTDFSLYDRGPLGRDERNHVRSWYLRARTKISDDFRVDLRYTRERDDEETYDLLSLSLTHDY